MISVTRINFKPSREELGKQDFEHSDLPSLTIVEKCMTVGELLQRAVQGLPVNVVYREYPPTGEYSDSDDLDYVSRNEFELSDDNLINLCSAKRMSISIERELKARESKAANANGGVSGTAVEPKSEEQPAKAE